MESSPNQHTANMDGRIDAALETIDQALAEYEAQVEHRRIDHNLAQGLVAKEVEVIEVLEIS